MDAQNSIVSDNSSIKEFNTKSNKKNKCLSSRSRIDNRKQTINRNGKKENGSRSSKTSTDGGSIASLSSSSSSSLSSSVSSSSTALPNPVAIVVNKRDVAAAKNCASSSLSSTSSSMPQSGNDLDDPDTIQSINTKSVNDTEWNRQKTESETENVNQCNAIPKSANRSENQSKIASNISNRKCILNDDQHHYNDFVNLICNDHMDDHILNTKDDHIDDVEQIEEIKPLLLEFQSEKQRPKSIVKSPSNVSFGCDKDKSTADSVQCTNFDPERPVLHVQFLQQQNGGIPSMYSINNGPTGAGCGSPTGSVSQSSSSDSCDDDEGSSIDQYSEAHPPDGGWGWVVVFASFIVNLIADGITFSFGVIYVEFLNYFNEGKAKTAWIGSLFMAMPLLSGPVASFLTDRYGCRKVTIAGSLLASLGFVISSQSHSMEMLFFTFGILAGMGLSLCYVAAVVIVAYYFDKRRSFATGLSVCGSGIGTFIFAPLTQYLLETYGWRGTTLILAGFFLNMCVCGMLMRDLEWTTHRAKLKAKQRKQNKLGISADSFSVSNSTNTGGTPSNLQQNDAADADNAKDENITPRLFSSLITLPTFMRNGEKVPLEVLELMSNNHRNLQHQALFQNYPGLAHSRSRSFSEPLSASHHSNGIVSPETIVSPTNPLQNQYSKSKSRQIRNEQAFLTWLKKNGIQKDNRHATAAYLKNLKMHRHSLTYRGAMLNINRYRLRASSCPDIYRNSMTTIAKEKFRWGQGFQDFKILLRDMLDFSYFADIRFVLFALSNFLLYTWYDVPYVYLADNAIENGFSESDASYLISVIGIVNMFGEIILGWLGDKKYVSPGVIYAICMGFCGVVTALIPLLTSYGALSIVSGLFGLFIAANYALTSIILVELITLERFTNAYGLLLLVQGIANLVGPPLAGWITDVTSNYDLAFYLAGIFIALSGVLMVILPTYGKCKKYQKNIEPTQIFYKSSIGEKCNGTKIFSKDIPGANHV